MDLSAVSFCATPCFHRWLFLLWVKFKGFKTACNFCDGMHKERRLVNLDLGRAAKAVDCKAIAISRIDQIHWSVSLNLKTLRQNRYFFVNIRHFQALYLVYFVVLSVCKSKSSLSHPTPCRHQHRVCSRAAGPQDHPQHVHKIMLQKKRTN